MPRSVRAAVELTRVANAVAAANGNVDATVHRRAAPQDRASQDESDLKRPAAVSTSKKTSLAGGRAKRKGAGQKGKSKKGGSRSRSRSRSPVPPGSADEDEFYYPEMPSSSAASDVDGGGGTGSGAVDLSTVDLTREADLTLFVRSAHRTVLTRRTGRRSDVLRAALAEGRDAVLGRARDARWMRVQANDDDMAVPDDSGEAGAGYEIRWTEGGRVFPRLPSNGCGAARSGLDPVLCGPCGAGSAPPPAAAASSASDDGSDGPAPSDEAVSVTFYSPRSAHARIRPPPSHTHTANPPVYLEGTHKPLPPSTTTVFLKTHYATEDEKELAYVPYFGDDDKEDVVTELYDTKLRERMVEFGTEIVERETNSTIDEVLEELVNRGLKDEDEREDGGGGSGKAQSGEEEEKKEDPATPKKKAAARTAEGERGSPERPIEVHNTSSSSDSENGTSQHDVFVRVLRRLADLMSVRAERIHERYRTKFGSRGGDKGSGGGKSEAGAGAPASPAGSAAPGTPLTPRTPGSPRTPTSRKKPATPTAIRKNTSTDVPIPYVDLMDSYRNLFCRRCFTYDCNMHGNLAKPDADLQAELAVLKEEEGHWAEVDQLPDLEASKKAKLAAAVAAASSAAGSAKENGVASSPAGRKRPRSGSSASSPSSPGQKRKSPKRGFGKRAHRHAAASPEKEQAEALTPLQKSICDRAFTVFRGDVAKVAVALGAPADAVAAYVREEGVRLKAPEHVAKSMVSEFQRRKKKGKGTDGRSMKNYNLTWLKRVQKAEIHPAFIPCDHSEPCDDSTCSCVRNAFFCTKHCVWGSKSRNYFRGCSCKAGQCRTKSCACFAAKRECDPDLCRTCGACSDPPNRPATTRQRCRNDNIGMRRHGHLLLAESTFQDAGWGVYTKHALKKGDFVHEYVGEVISQEEAERRGKVYDKINRSYLFNLSSDYVVDASRKGNKTKFANHSSKPNCDTRMVSVNGDIRIGLFAKYDIEAQSELFFDYRYDVGMDNDLIIKPGKTVDWMKDPKMANKISKKYA